MNAPDGTPIDIRCYVVNLRRRPDRRAEIAKQLPPNLSSAYTSDWPLEIDGRALDRDAPSAAGFGLFPWWIESDNPWWNRPLKWGEVGCAIAHIACWNAALVDGVDYAIVLEDDAVLMPAFAETVGDAIGRLGHPPSFGLLYLGRYPLAVDTPSEHPGLVVPGYSHCTFGYVLTRSGLRAAVDARLDRSIVPVDEFMPALYHPHPRHDCVNDSRRSSERSPSTRRW